MQRNEFDNQYRKGDIRNVAGVDEAGRGPLAGPVYAAAVIFPEDFYLEDINDSKKLSEKKREALFDIICEKALAYSISFVSAQIIDEINILNATFLAMKQAVDGLDIVPDFVLVDGNSSKGLELPHECVVKGDAKSQSIAAASILAKVARDRFLKNELANRYPEYLFEKHKGYGTKLHVEKLLEFGPCPEHRRSFLTKILQKKDTETQQ